MITITVDRKTYITRRSKMSMLMLISEWISKGFLEEVKENKEPDMAKLMDSEMRRVCLGETNTSILEKLRSDVQEIENRYKKSFEDTNDEYYQGGLAVACKILGLLTSLETPQFTPGQEIDHDQVKENIRVMDEQDGNIEQVTMPELPSVPNYNYDTQFHHSMPNVWQSNLAEQVEALTTFCQSLARQKPTK